MKKIFNFADYIHNRINDEVDSHIHYYINKEKRTIVATMENCEFDAIKVLDKMGLFNVSYNGYNLDKFMMNSIYRGKATCSILDEWNEEVGIQIARNRMLAKYYRARTSALKRAKKVFDKMMEEFDSRILYSEKRINYADSEKL